MTERQLQQAVIDTAHLLGWRCAHFRVRPAMYGGLADDAKEQAAAKLHATGFGA